MMGKRYRRKRLVEGWATKERNEGRDEKNAIRGVDNTSKPIETDPRAA